MTALNRKLMRDMWHMKGQLAAIAMVMACGVAMFVMSLSTMHSLEHTLDQYYQRHRFAQVFARVKRAPESLAGRIGKIPGVGQLHTRVVMDVSLDVPGLAEPAVGRLISVPDREQPGLNRLYLRRGRFVEPGRGNEVVVSEGFAVAHGLQPGDTVMAILNGRRQALRLVGEALSPEFVYPIREGELFPDEKRFGVFWMGRTELSAALDMQGAFNDLVATLTPGAVEAEVLRQIDALTEPYGGVGAIARADQMSHRYISNELEELRGMGKVAPYIFLGVAGFLLNVVVSRQVGIQREQIAVLKAFGYSQWEIGVHYMKFVLIVSAAGIALGLIGGAWLGRDITAIYSRFFHFPSFEFRIGLGVPILAAAVSMGSAMLGSLASVRRAMSLPPAEAMRPEPPPRYGPTLFERLGLQRFLTPSTLMILRRLERHPFKATLSTVGIALAVAIMVLGSYMKDAVEYAMESQFEVAQRQDLSVALVESSSEQAWREIGRLPGVGRCEPFRSVAARVRNGHRSRRLGLMGLPADGVLNRIMDVRRHMKPVPDDGLVLSKKLGEILEVAAGDTVVVEILEHERPVRTMIVHSLVDDFAGVSATMNIDVLNRLLHQADQVSGAFLAADERQRGILYATLKNTPKVASVTVKRAAMDSFRATLAENLLRMRLFNIFFAGVIAIGVVYNTARIALAERSHELATLRVIGFTRLEISIILLGELTVLTLAAIPLGLGIGYGFAYLISFTYNTELFRIPLIIHTATYAMAVIVILAAAIISGLIVRRRLDHLDLVAVLKAKE